MDTEKARRGKDTKGSDRGAWGIGCFLLAFPLMVAGGVSILNDGVGPAGIAMQAAALGLGYVGAKLRGGG